MASDNNADVANYNIQLLQDAVAKNARLEEVVGHEIDRISDVFIDHFVDCICIEKAGDLKAFNNDTFLFKS